MGSEIGQSREETKRIFSTQNSVKNARYTLIIQRYALINDIIPNIYTIQSFLLNVKFDYHKYAHLISSK